MKLRTTATCVSPKEHRSFIVALTTRDSERIQQLLSMNLVQIGHGNCLKMSSDVTEVDLTHHFSVDIKEKQYLPQACIIFILSLASRARS